MIHPFIDAYFFFMYNTGDFAPNAYIGVEDLVFKSLFLQFLIQTFKIYAKT